jgi:hypothetical protein
VRIEPGHVYEFRASAVSGFGEGPYELFLPQLGANCEDLPWLHVCGEPDC